MRGWRPSTGCTSGESDAPGDTDEEVADLLDAIERFEAAVEAKGGDLFVNRIGASEPENPAFVPPLASRGRAPRTTAADRSRGRAPAPALGLDEAVSDGVADELAYRAGCGAFA